MMAEFETRLPAVMVPFLNRKRQQAPGWSSVQSDVLHRVLHHLSRHHSWRKAAEPLHLVNKHWRDIIRQCFTAIHPHYGRPVSWPGDFKTLCTFSNLRSLFLEKCDALETVDEARLSVMTRLERLEISDSAAVEPVLDQVAQMESLEVLCLDHVHCCESAFVDCIVSLSSSLEELKLHRLYHLTTGDVMPALEQMTKLETLEMRMIGERNETPVRNLSHLTALRSLRLDTTAFDLGEIQSLSTLKSLTSLVLDGESDYDAVESSFLNGLEHLSLSSIHMPLWIGGLCRLKSLSLTSSDLFRDPDRQQALLSVVPQLSSLRFVCKAAPPSFTSHVLQETKDLQKLGMLNRYMLPDEISHLSHLKELDIRVTKNWHRGERNRMFRNLLQLIELESLKVDLPIGSSFFTMPPDAVWDDVGSNLTTLVVHGVNDEAVRKCLIWLDHLKDFRLIDCSIVVTKWLRTPRNKSLKNLCIAGHALIGTCQSKDALSQFLEWHRLPHLDHLALPRCYFSPTEHSGIANFRKLNPYIRVDQDPNWPTPFSD